MLLEALEMWTWRRMLKINWTEMTNEEVLVRGTEARSKLKMTSRRKRIRLGHVFRHDIVLHNIEMKILRMVTRGRKRMELLYDMMEWRYYGRLKGFYLRQIKIGDRTTDLNAFQKPAGNTKRLKKKHTTLCSANNTTSGGGWIKQ